MSNLEIPPRLVGRPGKGNTAARSGGSVALRDEGGDHRTIRITRRWREGAGDEIGVDS